MVCALRAGRGAEKKNPNPKQFLLTAETLQGEDEQWRNSAEQEARKSIRALNN